MIKKLVVLCSSLMLTGLTYAAQPMSSRIDLGNGSVSPAQTLKIPLKKLARGVRYNISCDIYTPAASHMDPVIARIFMQSSMMGAGSMFGEIRINDITVGYGQVQLKLPTEISAQLNIMEVVSASNEDALAIQNADQQNEIRIEGCFAEAIG